MAEDPTNIRTIRKKDTSFPGYLDFDRLRSEGIEYLGKLAGKIWTDHNVHDPGITILEMLCYALLDLGYRTGLPVEDILARDPSSDTEDDNFFTPAQILSCNPLTITDFRKLVIDIEHVRNAWLMPATDAVDFCRPVSNIDTSATHGHLPDNPECDTFLNGLYHVYLDLEKDIDRDFNDHSEAMAYRDSVIDEVKKALMAHRNLCEDFLDIRVLCKLPLGVCASVEIEEEASPEKVYVELVEALRTFFTPVPKFYTLSQLLARQKSIEEIFAGRPRDVVRSHGFVDTEEFEKLALRKEIHLSDVYNVIFAVTGVRSVRNLAIRSCDDNLLSTGWKYGIRENHVPEFSTGCSGFRFTRNGQELSVNEKKFERTFELSFSGNGNAAYRAPSPYLDLSIPGGNYRNDLAKYYSIQNEFPRVYGIEEGGLPEGAPDARKAQALQLKGFLLFFDQLLANYLSQLSHMRSLFALSSPEEKDDQHTYFLNQLDSVPELQKLLRFHTDHPDADHELGDAGSTLVFPVSKSRFFSMLESDQLKKVRPEDVQAYTFPAKAYRDMAISQLNNDFYQETVVTEFVMQSSDCIFYYLLGTSDDMVLVSRKTFTDLKSAQLHASSVRYIGTFDDNYRSFTDGAGQFSFTIELNLASYTRYLQLVVEDRPLYLERRQDFLNHLLARFAEKFTDYAVFSFRTFNEEQLEEAKIRAEERFLASYPDLSSTRGKGYDYLKNRWYGGNVSGLEKRVKMLFGMETAKRQSLCHFVVSRYEEQYEVKLELAQKDLFDVKEKYASREEAAAGVRDIFAALSDRIHYQIRYIAHEDGYSISATDGHREMAVFRRIYPTEEDACTVAGHLQRLFSGNRPEDSDVVVSRYTYYLLLQDHKGRTVRTSAGSYEQQSSAQFAASQFRKGINDPKRWVAVNDKVQQPGRLHHIEEEPSGSRFIDLDAFKMDVNDTIVGKPDKFTYDLLDAKNSFKFHPVRDFDSAKQAVSHGHILLTWMVLDGNYQVRQSRETGKYLLWITWEGKDEALCSADFLREDEAMEKKEEVLHIIRRHVYGLDISEVPYRMRFKYYLGIEPGEHFTFESVEEYPGREEALDASTAFGKAVSRLQLRKYRKELRLVASKTGEKVSAARLVSGTGERSERVLRESINEWLAVQKEVGEIIEGSGQAQLQRMTRLNAPSRQGSYVYRLVDKDNVPARFSEPFTDEGSADRKKKVLSGIECNAYSYLEICLGGDIVIKRKYQGSTAFGYHYLIKCRNYFYTTGEELVLFESTRGYVTEEDALDAFRDNYLKILHLASDADNYGKAICTTEKRSRPEQIPAADDCIVFVPEITMQETGGYDEASIKELVNIAKTYPIRLVYWQSDTFYKLFPCEDKPANRRNNGCAPDRDKPVYYFRLVTPGPDSRKDEHHWLSTRYYPTSDEARRDFRFFLILLCYPGNLFTECDECGVEGNRYGIFVREVLGESARRFASAEAAWGTEGVQRFICVSQSADAFHYYQGKEHQCSSFYMACSGGTIYHPCRYDTPTRRDEALNKLYRAMRRWYRSGAYQFAQDENKKGLLFQDEAGKPFARADIRRQEGLCEDLLKFLQQFAAGKIPHDTDDNGTEYLEDPATGIKVYPHEDSDQDNWRTVLEAFACYFPIVRKPETKTGNNRYCVEIRLPGFDSCPEPAAEIQPCGCDERETRHSPLCHAAWISRCCYDTCMEAMEVYRLAVRQLLEYENYRPLWDCSCREFGVAIHTATFDADAESGNADQGLLVRDGEMIALNPQCYSTPEMACEAADRAYRLINGEGLHVVEHILLRPRCEEDCRCEHYTAPCEDDTQCAFTWSGTATDPCEREPDICFVPGSDPYSFVATVVLPAWPARFRSAENRRLLEQLLYSEAPAHVLLRIQWLAPHDFCCFENLYRGWTRRLADKNNCVDGYSHCGFLGFLFDRKYECLEECEVCMPCGDDVPDADPCIGEDLRALPERSGFSDQINKLYCWVPQDCEGYRFIPCDEVKTEGTIDFAAAKSPAKTIPMTPVSVESGAKTVREEVPERYDEGAVTVKAEKETVPALPEQEAQKSKSQLLNSRQASYRMEVEQMYTKTDNHPVVEKIRLFLKDPQPSIERVRKILLETVENRKPEKGKKLTGIQVTALLQSILCYYLDKVCFGDYDLQRVRALSPTIGILRKKKVDMSAIFRYWQSGEVLKLEPRIDTSEIENVLMGKNNT